MVPQCFQRKKLFTRCWAHWYFPLDLPAVIVVRAYFHISLLSDEKRHYVDTDRWPPLIMSFCEVDGLGQQVHPSRLAKVF